MRWSLPVLASSLGVLLCSGLAARPGADPATTELLEPQPRSVHPGETAAAPPSDAIILFAGDNLDQWQPVSPDKPLWRVGDGVVTVVPGAANLRTRESFADVQLHLEWRSPGLAEHQRDLDTPLAGRIREQVESRYGMHQFLANSGVFLQQRYEVQVLETFGQATYVNGAAGAIYKQHVPEVTALRPAGQWQVYDIVFRAPRFGEQGALIAPAHMTVLLNGVLIHNHVALWGPTEFVGAPRYVAHSKAPLELQSHVGISQISYRNIWVRPL